MENEEISVLKAFLAKQYADLFKCPSLEKKAQSAKGSIDEVAKHYEIPALGIFCSTNHIHKESQKEFFSNHKKAMQNLEDYIRTRKNG